MTRYMMTQDAMEKYEEYKIEKYEEEMMRIKGEVMPRNTLTFVSTAIVMKHMGLTVFVMIVKKRVCILKNIRMILKIMSPIPSVIVVKKALYQQLVKLARTV